MPGVIDAVFDNEVGPTRVRVVGAEGGRAPLVLVHGGPGLTLDYLAEFEDLAADGFPVIAYDQLGTGGSSATPAEAVSLVSLLEQLDAVLRHAVGARRYTILAHSAGSVIGLEHALRRPAGLGRLVIANGFAASADAARSIARLVKELPQEQYAAVKASDFQNPDYHAAAGTFYGRHVFRTAPSGGLQRTFAALAENSGVNQRLWGPDIFHLNGLYTGWSVADRLPEITVPTLVYRGEYDETGAECMDPLLAGLPHVEGVVIGDASHLPHMERRDFTIDMVRDFLLAAG